MIYDYDNEVNMNKSIENNVKYIWNKMKNHRHEIEVLQGERREKDAVSFV